ncbi:MAG: N-6 DNA methylase [Verrucomicrobia bacterium]|nr:N-6 DNA methylase [Verrucomicrobiota bacterium]
MPENSDKSLEFWIWDAASSILCAKDAPKFKEFILPLIFTKRLCDVFDDEINRIAQEVGTRGMANMNVIIHDMEGENQIGDTFRNPKFRQGNRLQTFDRVVANPVWNQTEFKEKDYEADEYRPLAEILEELEEIKEEPAQTDAVLKKVLERIGARTALSARIENGSRLADKAVRAPLSRTP